MAIKNKSKKGTREYSVSKRCANSIYGLMLQDCSPLNMYECGQAVTGFARETIDIVRKQMLNVGIQPLTIDTDGCELLVQSAEDIKKVKETASQITEIFENMELEFDGPHRAVFPSGKK